jgi:hypothetical protein
MRYFLKFAKPAQNLNISGEDYEAGESQQVADATCLPVCKATHGRQAHH